MSDEGMNLTEEEAYHLATRIAARRLTAPGEWLAWEDYPMLGQYAFERLVEQVAEVGRELATEGRAQDDLFKIDSAYLEERAQG